MNAFTLAVLAAASAPAQPIPPPSLAGATPPAATAPAPTAAPPGAPAPAAPATTDVRFVGKRTLNVPVNFRPERIKELQEARLFVSRDGGDLYEIGDRIDPSQKTEFNYTAKEDGEYWVQLQLVFKDGTVEPKNPRAIPPAEKVVVDTVKPVVVITTAEMVGDEAVVEWRIDDKHPADANTRIWYKPTGSGDTSWQEVPATAINKRTARFKPVVAGAITVQVTTADLARNIGHLNKDVTGFTRVVNSTPVPPGGPDGAPTPPAGLGGSSGKDPFGPAAPSPRPSFETEPTRPEQIRPELTRPEQTRPTTPTHPPTYPPAESLKPIARSDNPPPPPPAGGWGTTPGTPPPAPAPVEQPTAQFSRSPRFELNYTLDSGASGVVRVDLYVTRDDGRTWVRWSQHDGRETPLKVVLDTRFNKELEGDYGFALVPVSGAGLSEGAPTAGTAPELKVRVDTTAPIIKVYAPTADPNNKAALMLNWEATDKNFGRDPIAIEYAEAPQGPWKSVTGTDGPSVARVENTGTFSWQPPLNLATPKVYLRFSAWDQAGNKSEVITPQPILVDLTKPKARIQGISTGPVTPGR